MKIILDESAPQKLRLLIDNRHVVVTTWFQGWSGRKKRASTCSSLPIKRSAINRI